MTEQLRVLIVEDSENDARLVEHELRRGGFDVKTSRVDTDAELREALARGGWDAVLSDYMMPGFTGLDALRTVREVEPDLPFILVSGAVGEEVAVDAMRAGAQDYVMKHNLARLPQAVRREIAEAENRRLRKRVEQALVESEERLRMVVRATRDGIWDWDLRTNVIWCNEATLDLLGRPPAGAVTGSWRSSRVHPDDRDRVGRFFREESMTQGSRGIEYRLQRPDGTYAHVFDRCLVMNGEDGQPRRLIGATMDVTERRRMEQALQDANQKLKHLSAHVLGIQENERRFIARELHDEVGQALTALKIGLETLALSGFAPQAGISLAELAEVASRTLMNVRDLTLSLRPPQLDDLGLIAALRWHLDQQSRVCGWQAVFEADPLPSRLESGLETACFRFVQEALTNTARHAKASRVELRMRLVDGRMHLSVSDDGEGFDTAEARARIMRGGSVGLAGMEERIMLAGGRFEIGSAPGQGTTVRAELPLKVRGADGA